ncbi:hypothetical protein ROZALSC1DRAFT_28956, partial [Rozella allomycis CSF55]
VLVDSSSFEDYRKKSAYYVDKSLFIEEFINSGYKVEVILRPRRFGKSLNLSMLKSFFHIGSDPNLFKDLKIYEKKELMEKYCGKYPVVHLDLKDVVGSSFEECLDQLWKEFKRMVEPHQAVIKSAYPGQDVYGIYKRTSPRPCTGTLSGFLKMVMKILCEYYKQRVIVLVDEYDAPLNNAQKEGFFDQTIDFFWRLFSEALKDNDDVLKNACIMGVFEIRASGLSPQFDNFVVHSYSDMRYSSCFGFTLEEVRQLGFDEGDVEKAMNLYDGFKSLFNNDVAQEWQKI